jgi:outer membrane protein assembly factor BamD
MADDAQMKVAAINVRLMRGFDRDPTYVIRAQQELTKLLDDYPESELSPTAAEILREVEENRATGIKSVGDFYFNKRSFLGSESRYKEVIEEYPNFSRLDESLFRLGISLEELGRIEEASVYYSRLVAEFPFSDYSKDSEERLVLLERPIPPVDAAAAERNAANQRIEEGFSLLAPIRGVWGVFAGREDPYEIAKRRAARRRAQEQQTSSAELPSRDEVGSRQLSP